MFVCLGPKSWSEVCHYAPLSLVALVVSVLSNISAIGGGIVGVPVIILFYKLSPVIALKASLGTQCFGLSTGAYSWWRSGCVPARGLRSTIPGLLIGSTISSLVVHADAFLIKGVFGPVSIILGLIALATLARNDQSGRDDIPDSAAWPMFFASIVGGLITGWVSVGEGEIIAALLMLGYGVKAKRSIALGVVLLALNSIYLTIIHSLFLGGIPWNIAVFFIVGALFGARLAPYFALIVSPRTLKIIFAVIAILDGMLFICQFAQHAPR
jgi:uncharacterized membrane protein YfcA